MICTWIHFESHEAFYLMLLLLIIISQIWKFINFGCFIWFQFIWSMLRYIELMQQGRTCYHGFVLMKAKFGEMLFLFAYPPGCQYRNIDHVMPISRRKATMVWYQYQVFIKAFNWFVSISTWIWSFGIPLKRSRAQNKF